MEACYVYFKQLEKAKLANEFNVAILYDIEGRSEVGALNERDETIINNVS